MSALQSTCTEPHVTAASAPAEQPRWMSMQEAAVYARRHYQTVFAACRRYTAGDRSFKALKNFQDGPGCKRDLLLADVERWIQRMPPSRATRVA